MRSELLLPTLRTGRAKSGDWYSANWANHDARCATGRELAPLGASTVREPGRFELRDSRKFRSEISESEMAASGTCASMLSSISARGGI
jgi:hypothetical protein